MSTADVIMDKQSEENNEVNEENHKKGEEQCIADIPLEEKPGDKASEIDTREETSKQAGTSIPEESCSETPTDEYRYLKSGEFTSEMFEVIVKHIPPRISTGCFRSTIQDYLGFKPKEVRYNTRKPYAFLAFSNEEEMKKALSILNDQVWRNCTLLCEVALPMKDPSMLKHNKRKLDSHGGDGKQQKLDEKDVDMSPEDRIANIVCPYASKPYDEQLVLKEQHIRTAMQRLTNNLIHNKIGSDWMSRKKDKLCLDLLPIIKSPVLNYYRNKVEFTIGVGIDGKGNTVGFRLGSYREGLMSIVEPSKCINCSLKSLEVAKEFQVFIRSLSHSSYNPSTHLGFWQQLTVRSCLTDDVMVIIQVKPSHLSAEELDDVERKIKDFFTCSEQSVKVSSVYRSSSSLHNNDNIDTFKHLVGNEFINERLLDLQFRISPDTFFKVNTAAAEILYHTIYSWCDTSQENACVLDVCCGTGIIALCLANGTSYEVTGIEISKQAVEDARHNAEFNGIKNANFVCGPAEVVISATVKNIKTENIIAVVDPPRAGLHKNLIEALRACSAIKKVIYVSRNPNQCAKNFLSFCRPQSKRLRGTPFKTVRAVPVDLFPHARQCELIVELVRVGYEENGVSNEVQSEASEVNDNEIFFY